MLIQATLNWHAVGQPTNPCANVFHYKSFLAVTDELHAFTDNFVANVLPAIQAVTASPTIFTSVVSIDLADPAGEYTALLPTGTTGDVSADMLPLWVTLSFEYRRKTRGDRSGRKGLGAVAETYSTDGVLNPGFQGAVDTCAAALGATLMVGLIETWFPVIGVRPAVPTDPWTSHDISGVLFKRLGSQNTRKR